LVLDLGALLAGLAVGLLPAFGKAGGGDTAALWPLARALALWLAIPSRLWGGGPLRAGPPRLAPAARPRGARRRPARAPSARGPAGSGLLWLLAKRLDLPHARRCFAALEGGDHFRGQVAELARPTGLLGRRLLLPGASRGRGGGPAGLLRGRRDADIARGSE